MMDAILPAHPELCPKRTYLYIGRHFCIKTFNHAWIETNGYVFLNMILNMDIRLVKKVPFIDTFHQLHRSFGPIGSTLHMDQLKIVGSTYLLVLKLF